ncbi:MAG: hypothetical protein KTR19_11000 [Hyphomicrobiales bacterium]|nr:hypothetical protein [Hyphomicrobiales bacterium]
MIKSHPDWLFVFGDNLERKGYGGQARAARDEPNAVGIATKRSPGMGPDDFFTDGDKTKWEASSAEDLNRLRRHIHAGGVVIWPLDGIGTGLAKLPECAPSIHQAIEEFKHALEDSSL